MSRERWISIASVIALTGGLSWLAKVFVIVVTGGTVVDTGFAALFYVLGLALLVVGSTSVGVLLTGLRSRLVLASAAIISPIVFIASFLILDSLAKAIVGDHGPITEDSRCCRGDVITLTELRAAAHTLFRA